MLTLKCNNPRRTESMQRTKYGVLTINSCPVTIVFSRKTFKQLIKRNQDFCKWFYKHSHFINAVCETNNTTVIC